MAVQANESFAGLRDASCAVLPNPWRTVLGLRLHGGYTVRDGVRGWMSRRVRFAPFYPEKHMRFRLGRGAFPTGQTFGPRSRFLFKMAKMLVLIPKHAVFGPGLVAFGGAFLYNIPVTWKGGYPQV